MNLANFSFILWLAGADFLRSTGKIYTVALVALVIWLTILFYLIRLEKKIKNIEDRLK